MTLLERMRDVIGEEKYTVKLQHVLAAFPKFSTLEESVDVIKIDDDDDVIIIGSTPSTIKKRKKPVGSVDVNQRPC